MTRSFSSSQLCSQRAGVQSPPCLTHVGEKGEAEWGIGKTNTGLVCKWSCISAVKHLTVSLWTTNGLETTVREAPKYGTEQ